MRTASAIVQFGVFQFNGETLELIKNGVRIPLQLQPARLLALLLSTPGKLVPRELIRETLWRDGTTVDFEIGVNRYVRQLRVALGDDAGIPRYIRTMPRLGYCFIAPIAGPSPASARLAAAHEELSPSIAVLPFANIGGDPADEYFGDGLAEEITHALAQMGGLRVVARTSAFAFKGRNEDIRKVAQILNVDNVIEGSVRRSVERVRVTVQLIDASDGAHRLSKRYDRQATDIFALQDEIATDIAAQLKLSLIGEPRQTTVNLAAFEAYLEGRFHWRRYSPADFEKSLKCFEHATAADSGYAQAYTGIAQSRLGLVTEGGISALDMLPQAAAAARRALELDWLNAEAHAVLGQTAAMLNYDWKLAGKHFQRALELNPTSYVRLAYATWYLLPCGRALDAVTQADSVIQDDPLHLIGRVSRGVGFMFARQYDAAADACLRALEIDPVFPKAIQCLSFITGNQEKFAESVAWAKRLMDIWDQSYASLYTLAQAYAVSGQTDAAWKTLAELQRLPGSTHACPARIALLYGLLGDLDRGFEWLKQAIQCREPTILWMKTQPRMDCFRDDTRFAAALQRLNLSAT